MGQAVVDLNKEELAEIERLADRGLYLSAYRRAEALGPLRQWTGAHGRVLASRLARYLGAPRLSLWHLLKAWRENPENPLVRYFYGVTVLAEAGPYEAFLFLKEHRELCGADAEQLAFWYSLHGQVYGLLRDFERAERWLQRALDTGVELPWVHVVRASVLEFEDRAEEALQAVERSLHLQPWNRPAVQSKAHLLTLLDRDDEAFEFLTTAADQIECADLCWQISLIHLERDDYAAANRAVEKYAAMAPLMERVVRGDYFNYRAYLAYLLGDDEAAIGFARKCGRESAQRFVARLLDPARKGRRRVVLPVGFVRQNYLTCGPATLTAISRYWSMPAEHLQVAEEICYDGTSDYSERKWAVTHGWAARSFTVTEEAAEQLIGAGVPFTISTVDPGNAHLQAVVGCDGRRGSLIFRDSTIRTRGEADCEEFLARYRAFGPRGMALTPLAEARRIEGLALPDANLWNRIYELDHALQNHDRPKAASIVDGFRADCPEHFLAFEAARRLAVYDGNPLAELESVERLRERFPGNAVLDLIRLELMRHLGRRQSRLDALEELHAQPDADSAFLPALAQELAADARTHDRAIQLLRRAIRKRPGDSWCYYLLGSVLQDQLRFDEALELHRFAACLSDKKEQYSECYFTAAQYVRATDEALGWLRRRFERFGDKSGLPAQTLVWALQCLERPEEALRVVEEAVRRRPKDGSLKLFAAQVYATTSGDCLGRARELLDEAESQCSRPDWLHAAGQIAWCSGHLAKAADLLQQVLAIQPLSIDIHRRVTQLLSETQGKEAALAHLRAAVERFPHHQPLLELWIEWLRDEPPEVVEPVIRQLIEANPAHAWAVRELGFLLVRMGRVDEAEQCAARAGELDPNHVSWRHLRGDIAESRRQLREARSEYREAIQLSVDNEYAMTRLLACCRTMDQRRESLAFVQRELVRQVVFGPGLLTYRDLAHGILDADELLASLRTALDARPDLWHAWSACVAQLMIMERFDEAERLARQAIERFPLLPRAWIDLAEIYRVKGDADAEQAALTQAHKINPSWSEATRRLAELHKRRGQWDEARRLLELAVARDPLNCLNYGWLAEVLWRQNERQAALNHIVRALHLRPDYDWAWTQLGQWSGEAGQLHLREQTAREIAERMPFRAQSWLTLARALDNGERLDECLALLNKAAGLQPTMIEIHDEQARLLANAGRYDEARAACRPEGVWPDKPPVELAARAAWVDWVAGNADDAIAQLRLALEDDQTQPWMWELLTRWCRESYDAAGYREAAARWLRLEPFRDTALASYADALLVSGDREAAKRAFRRTIELAPEFAFAAERLFDLQLEDKEFEQAQETIEAIRAADGELGLLFAIRLAALRADLASATESFRQLSSRTTLDEGRLQAAVQTLQSANWAPMALTVLEEAMNCEGAAKCVGRYWAKLMAMRGGQISSERWRQLVASNPAGEHAVNGYIDGLLSEDEQHACIRFLQRNAAWLKTRTFTWGSAGWAWTSLRCWPAAYDWMKDWRDHPDAEPWMLVNAAEAFRARGRDADAAEISRHSLAHLPEAYGQHLHRIWLAADAVKEGRYSEALQRLVTVNEESLDGDYRFMFALIEAAAKAGLFADGTDASPFVKLRDRIDTAARHYRSVLQFEPARRRFYYFVLRHVARCEASACRRAGLRPPGAARSERSGPGGPVLSALRRQLTAWRARLWALWRRVTH